MELSHNCHQIGDLSSCSPLPIWVPSWLMACTVSGKYYVAARTATHKACGLSGVVAPPGKPGKMGSWPYDCQISHIQQSVFFSPASFSSFAVGILSSKSSNPQDYSPQGACLHPYYLWLLWQLQLTTELCRRMGKICTVNRAWSMVVLVAAWTQPLILEGRWHCYCQ